MKGQHKCFAGHRLIEFSQSARNTMRQIAQRLSPHEQTIIEGWVDMQCDTWHPPGFTRDSLTRVFGRIVRVVLSAMNSGELEACVDELERIGGQLAEQQFPFDALIISVHFFEETYLQFLLDPTPDQPGDWLVAIDEFLHVALAAISNAYFEAYRKELVESVEVGRMVQDNLLADIPDQIADLEVAHAYISAQTKAQLGGDFLDYFQLEPNADVFVIGDLSGHGVEAVAESLSLRMLFRGFMREHPDISIAMERLNDVVYNDLRAGHFATALAISYKGDGRLQIVNAGHPPPVLCRGEQPVEHGMALSVFYGAVYEPQEIVIQPGETFVAYTDGLIEAHGPDGMYGEERLAETVSSMRNAPPEAIIQRLLKEARQFGCGRFADDVAILVLRRRVE